MSVMDHRKVKVQLPRKAGSDPFWELMEREFAGDDPRRWKYLAMLALRENAGWPMAAIGKVFDHPKGHVSRCLVRIKQQIRDKFEIEPELLSATAEADVNAPPERAAA